MTQPLNPWLLVNVSLALAFAVFYGLVKLCIASGISPWWSGVIVLGVYLTWIWKSCRRTISVIAAISLPVHADAFADSGVGAAIGGFAVAVLAGTSTSPDNPSTAQDDDDDGN
jgi:hypothetical protein